MRVIFGVLAIFGVSAFAGVLTEEDYRFHFGNFQVQYNKNYETSEEFMSRLDVFKANLDMINEHNAQNKSWTLAVNEFADMSWEEFKQNYLGLAAPSNLPSLSTVETYDDNFMVPASVDWRTKGVVNAVKNQKHCGSCWAFSTVASIESACALKTGHLHSLSEQQLVDCSGSFGNGGCKGGWVDRAFKYEEASRGLCLESDYPYNAAGGSCHSAKCTKYCAIRGFVDVKRNDETALMRAVAQQPVSIAIEADQKGFQFYSGGVFDGACGTSLDHAVVIDGYGTSNGKMYWLVRNSWGSNWGEKGYIRMIRHDGQHSGQCGLAMAASYPTM
jgi:xylem cysteine proteinase